MTQGNTHPPDIAPRLLICEDESLLANTLTMEFMDRGALVVASVAKVDQAMELAQQEMLEVDVVVLELRLAAHSAYPVARAFRERGVGLVFYSGYSADVVPEEFAAVPFVPKPASPATVYEAVLLEFGRARERAAANASADRRQA